MMCPSAGELNLCLSAVDLSGGGVYSIKMELLNHQDGINQVKEEVDEQRAGSALCAASEG